MPAKYNTRYLTEKDVALTFPLIQALYGEATLPEWSDFARARIGTGTCQNQPETPKVKGIVIAENTHKYIQGLFCYTLNPDTFLGPTMICDQFIAFDLVGIDSPYLALLEEAEAIARRHGSTRLDLHVPKGLLPPATVHSRLHALLHESGHEANSLRYCKSLA